MSRIQVDMDISDVVSNTQKLTTLLNAQANSFRDVLSATVSTNQSTGATTQIIREQINARQQLITTVREDANGQKTVTTAIKETNNALKLQAQELAKANRERAEANRILARTKTALAEATKSGDLSALAGVDSLLKRISGTVANLALYRGFNLVGGLIGGAPGLAREYETQLNLIRTVTQNVATTTQQYGDIVKRVASQTGLDYKDIAAAAYDAASAQTASGPAIEGFLKNAGNLAKTTGSNIQDAGKVISSVLNTFGREAGSNEEIAAKLFSTVDIGGLKINDLSQNFGNVAFLAQNLGVSFNEVLATLSALTRQGLSTNEAVTILNATLQKILKPTENLKTSFDSLGFSSGASAIGVKGLFGTLKDLTNLVNTGKLNVADLFSEERAVKFFASFTNKTKEFEKDLDKISNRADKPFGRAIDIVNDGPAAQIQRTLETAKNAFAGGVGDAINKLVSQFVDLTDKSEKFEQQVASLVKGITFFGAAAGSTFLILKTGVIVETALAAAQVRTAATTLAKTTQSQLASAQITREVAATTALTAAESRLTAARAGIGGALFANPVVGIAAALAATIAVATVFDQALPEAVGKSTQAYEEFSKKLAADKLDEKFKKSVDEVEKFRKSLQQVTNTAGDGLAKAIKANQDSLTGIRDRLNQSGEILRSKFVGFLDIARNRVQELEREFGQLDGRIRQTGKSSEEFADRVAASKRKGIAEFGDPVQQQEQILSEFDRVTAKAEQLFAQGTKESVDEARKLFDDALGLIDQLQTKQFELQKQAAEGSIRLTGPDSQQKFDEFGRLQLDTSPFDQKRDELLKRRQALEGQERQSLEQRKKDQEVVIAKEKERLATVEATLKKFQEFNFLDSSGNVKNQFLDQFGKVDVNKVNNAFNKLIEDVKKLDPEITKSLDLGKLIQDRADLINKEAKGVLVGQELANAQQKLKQAQDNANQSFADGRKLVEEYTKSLQALAQTASTIAGVAGERFSPQQADEFNRSLLVDKNGKFAGNLSSLFDQVVGSKVEKNNSLQGIRDAFKALSEEGEKLQREFQESTKKTKKVGNVEVIDPDAFEQSLNRLRDFYQNRVPEVVRNSARLAQTTVEDPSTLIVGKGGQTLRTLQNDLNSLFKEFSDARQKLDAGNSLLDASKQGLDKFNDLSKQISQNFGSANEAQAALFGGITTGAARGESAIKQLLDSVKLLNAELEKFKTGEAIIQDRQNAVGGAVGGGAFQFGGKIHFADGGPIGSDNRMIYAQDGEFMATRAATRMFYPQLTNMNNVARTPNTFNTQGATTNFGGVNFNISESNSPRMTAQEVHNKLRRAKRMGAL